MSTAIATATAAALEPQTLAEAEHYSKRLSESGLMPSTLRGKPADVLVVMLTGRELGVSPLTAIRSIHVVQGRPVLDAALIVALVKKSPACMYFQLVESTATRATYETQRKGEPRPTTMSYTIEQAKAAGLTGKDNWRNHPDAMLRARASSALARAVYPDLVLNVLTDEEAEQIPHAQVVSSPAPVTAPRPSAQEPTDAEIVPEVSEQQVIDSFLERIVAAADAAELKAISAEVRQMAKPIRDAVRGTYEAKLAEVKAAGAEVQG